MPEELLLDLSYVAIFLTLALILCFLIAAVLTFIKRIRSKEKFVKIKFYKFLDIYLVLYTFFMLFLAGGWLLNLFM